MTLAQLNSLSRDEFVRIVKPVFEHSPWIAEAAWPKRPFASVEELHRALCATILAAGEEKQVALIRAHPDLVGRGTLTPEEIAAFQKSNAAYREKFGFPFVICARLNKKEAILNGFRVRLSNSREQEMQTALEEIGKIAWLRLKDLVAG